MLKWTTRGEQRQMLVNAAPSAAQRVAPDTYQYLAGSTKLDIDAEFRLTRQAALYCTARNVTNEKYILKRYSSVTPAYARTYNTQEFGVQMVFGIRISL
jgi:hypothetical protein